MMHTQIQVIKLSCVSCSSNLDISQNINRLACGHCGTQQIVERSGGAIYLRGIAEAISKVQVGTDKTAAELALARISNEIEVTHYQRTERVEYWMSIKTQKLYKWKVFIEAKNRKLNHYAMLAAICGVIPIGIFAFLISRLIPDQFIAVIFIIMVILFTMPIIIFFEKNRLEKKDEDNPDKLQENCNKEISSLDQLIAKDLSEIDGKIVALNDKLQQNYQIANS